MTVLGPAKEILGVDNAPVQLVPGHLNAAGPLARSPSAAVPSSPARLRLLLTNSQYFSVFLSISV